MNGLEQEMVQEQTAIALAHRSGFPYKNDIY